MDFLTPSELSLILTDVRDLLADPQLRVSVTYRAYQSRTFTPSIGAVVPVYTDTVLGAIRNEMPVREIVASAGLYRTGDLRFIIERAALATEPNKDDHLIDGSVTYDLISWDSDPVSALWRIVARQVA